MIRKIFLLFLTVSLAVMLDNSVASKAKDRKFFKDLTLELIQGNSQANATHLSKSDLLNRDQLTPKSSNNCQTRNEQPKFLVMGGGGSPQSNEIALEKNILYFQRTLKQMGYNPASANLFFANGTDGQATIRYLDAQARERFKSPSIPHLKGAATRDNFQQWIQQSRNHPQKQPIFFYFTGHGILNQENDDNSALLLWENTLLTVRELSQLLDRLPSDSHIVTMMAQCFSGSFANFIYQQGNPNQPLALQTRCSFFATVKTLPSVGCTPEVNEADYQDYSSSFFAGLSGVNRLGKSVASADYNRDERISYSEAHAFAKVDEKTPDLPVSTSEVWLQQKITDADFNRIANQPIIYWKNRARPEQKYVVDSLMKRFKFNPKLSHSDNFDRLHPSQMETEEQQAYQMRLVMELLNIGMEEKIRKSQQKSEIASLKRLIACEASSWR